MGGRGEYWQNSPPHGEWLGGEQLPAKSSPHSGGEHLVIYEGKHLVIAGFTPQWEGAFWAEGGSGGSMFYTFRISFSEKFTPEWGGAWGGAFWGCGGEGGSGSPHGESGFVHPYTKNRVVRAGPYPGSRDPPFVRIQWLVWLYVATPTAYHNAQRPRGVGRSHLQGVRRG